MAKLTAEERDRLKDDQFALPGRRYPIQDLEHGEKAIQLGAKAVKGGTLSSDEYRRVKAIVHHRFPDIGESEGARS